LPVAAAVSRSSWDFEVPITSKPSVPINEPVRRSSLAFLRTRKAPAKRSKGQKKNR